VRGGAPGTRETDALAPTTLVERIDAVVLSGGSAFGLEAASAITTALAAAGRGFPVGAVRVPVPVVPAAILFDLLNGGDKAWGESPPYSALGRAALAAAERSFDLGNSGAGFGARAGSLKGGLGSASAVSADGLQVGALVAVNSHGETTMPGSSCFWAWALAQPGEVGPQHPPTWPLPSDPPPYPSPMAGGHTSIGVVAANATLTRAEAQRVAIMAQDGLARDQAGPHAVRWRYHLRVGDGAMGITGTASRNGVADRRYRRRLRRPGPHARDLLGGEAR
jgi:L-aminopeptidase/D-esterase-like protein